MNKRTIILAGILGALSACSAHPVPATDTYAQRFVGPWRIALVDTQGVFSDYVFGKAGALTHLLSVADGQPVAPMQGAGVVHSDDLGAIRCTFGTEWNSPDRDTLVINGACDDSMDRDIELTFADETRTSSVVVQTVGGLKGWSQVGAWRFQKCDLHPCGN
jgi:hypothetical protein